MSALGQKQTLRSQLSMSALPPIADIARAWTATLRFEVAHAGGITNCAGDASSYALTITPLAHLGRVIEAGSSLGSYETAPQTQYALPEPQKICLTRFAPLLSTDFASRSSVQVNGGRDH